MNATWNWFLAEAGRGAAFLFQWSWQALVVLACVWLGLKAFRAQSPAIRCQVWLFGLIAVAAMPLWASIANVFPLPQPRIETLRYAAEMPAMVITAKPEPATVNAATLAIQATAKPSLLLPAIFALWLIGALITLVRIIRCGFIEFGPNGETWNKAQAIAEVKRLDYTIKKFEFDDLRVSGNEHVPGHISGDGLFRLQRAGVNRAVPLHGELHQAGWAVEDCGGSYEPQIVAAHLAFKRKGRRPAIGGLPFSWVFGNCRGMPQYIVVNQSSQF